MNVHGIINTSGLFVNVARNAKYSRFHGQTKIDLLLIVHLLERIARASVLYICVIHEAMNGCKNLKVHKRIAFKIKYNILTWPARLC